MRQLEKLAQEWEEREVEWREMRSLKLEISVGVE